jgi:hypothetical protein
MWIFQLIIIALIVYVISQGVLDGIKIALIAIISVICLMILDKFKNYTEYFESELIPPGGSRQKILPNVAHKFKFMNPRKCQELLSYARANPIATMGDPLINQRLKSCHLAKHVKFNDRVQTLSHSGTIGDESLTCFDD